MLANNKNKQPQPSEAIYGKSNTSTSDDSIESRLGLIVNEVVNSRITTLLTEPAFLESLKDKLGIAPPLDEFIDTFNVCSLLKISRTTCHYRVKSGILITHRTTGSRKVMFSRKQVLSTLQSITILKRPF